MSDEKKKSEVNEVVAAMGKTVLPDVPTGLAVVPKGANVHALARRMAGEVVQNELEFHCMSCGWNKSLQFDPDEIEALDGDIRGYTGPCPTCSAMTLVPKDSYWGKDFPTMSEAAAKGKREDARVQAEELVNAVTEKVGDLMGGGIPRPTIEDPEDTRKEDLPDEADLSNLKPR